MYVIYKEVTGARKSGQKEVKEIQNQKPHTKI
jgi:hypothetical protein